MKKTVLQVESLERPLLLDGATGTYLEALAGELDDETRNFLPLVNPSLVRRIHRDYLEAGADIIKTATFNASVLGLGLRPGDGDAEARVRELNSEAALLASAEAAAAAGRDGRQRYVAASVGPGPAAPSLGGPGRDELVASYRPQMEGLLEGGVDCVLIETVQDVIQLKAAMEALRLAGQARGNTPPFLASATLDDAGRLLSGASPSAFAAAIDPLRPLAIGFNCSAGPAELAPFYSELALASSSPLFFMPNAGKPRSSGGRVVWPLGPGEFAGECARALADTRPAFVGGCCGTGPAHIAALRERLPSLGKPRAARGRVFALASNFDAFTLKPGGLFAVDERANASGSAAFRRIIAAEDLDEAQRFVVGRAATGAFAVDINVAGSAERRLLPELARRCAGQCRAALSLDSLDGEALSAALAWVGGRALINSVNLEDEGRALGVMELAAAQGAALVCLSVDAEGPARSADRKLSVAARLYRLALSAGLSPEDLLFDLCTFPAAAGGADFEGSAWETLEAVARLGEYCPGSASVLGVGNVSYGLPKALRPAFTAAFLARARKAGLAAAIVDPAVARLDPEADPDLARSFMLAAPFFEPGPLAPGALEALLALADARTDVPLSSAAAPSPVAGTARGEDAAESGLEPLKALAAHIAQGARVPALEAAAAALGRGQAAEALAAAIAGAMAELGKRYDQGALPLPLVLRSADVARACFDSIRPGEAARREGREADGASSSGRPLVVLSTVRGDLHDIGKNLVAMVLESGGYTVRDLGTDRSAEDIVAAALAEGAGAVGLSGLLTRSLAQMEKVAGLLRDSGSGALLLCGGAAVDESFVRERVEPLLPGRARYGKDPFAALEALKGVAAPNSLPTRSASPAAAAGASVAEAPATEAPAAEAPAGARASTRAHSQAAAIVPFAELTKRLDLPTIAQARLGYGRPNRTGGEDLIRRVLALLEAGGALDARYVLGWFRVSKEPGDVLCLVRATDGFTARFAFPRERAGRKRSVYDNFSDGSLAPAFCATLGDEAGRALAVMKATGDSSLYLAGHAVLAGLAEAAAEGVHERAARELADRGLASPGKRYSFGYPSCPGVEANGPLLDLLGAESIGLALSSGFQLVPEFSVSALIVPDNSAEYFVP